MRSIVVGVDESSGAAEALRWAARERALHDCSLTAVMCWSYLEQHQPTPDRPFDPVYGDDAARRVLATIVENVLGEDAVDVNQRTVNDLPARGLLESASGADLLVLGARGLGAFRRIMLGSVSRQCLHHAASPVAVVRQRENDPEPGELPRAAGGSILVGVDGSASAQRALDWALDETRRRQAAVTVLHTWTPAYVGGAYVPALVYDTTEIERAASGLVDAAVDAADTTGLPVAVEKRIECGAPGATIVAAASDADLLVVGSRGLGGFKGLLLGSVSDHAASHTPCPVVVVPHAEKTMADRKE